MNKGGHHEILATLAISLVAPALQAVFKALISDETLRQVAHSLTQRRVVVAFLTVLGVVQSLLFSYYDWLRVADPRQAWWETVYLEAGMGLVLIGFIDTLIMSRLENRSTNLTGANRSRAWQSKEAQCEVAFPQTDATARPPDSVAGALVDRDRAPDQFKPGQAALASDAPVAAAAKL